MKDIMNAYTRLASAIVIQAVEDYRSIEKARKPMEDRVRINTERADFYEREVIKNIGKDQAKVDEAMRLYKIYNNLREVNNTLLNGKLYSKKSIEKFFHSDWCFFLCNVDGDYILRHIDSQIKQPN